MAFDRQTDPKQIKVQLNVRIPWELREKVIAVAEKRRMSVNTLILQLIERELDVNVHQATKNAGATK
jgi:predicted HicB family RNase H-like nuclease